MMKLTASLAEDMIFDDSNDGRFEAFCNEIISQAHGLTVMATSRTADLGTDGRSLQLDALAPAVRIATSVRADFAKKFSEDAERILEKFANCTIVFCTNRRVTEKKLEQSRNELSTLMGEGFKIEILTCIQLADMAARFPAVFQRHYTVEMEEARQRIAQVAQEPVGVLQVQVARVVASEDGQDGAGRLVDALVSEALMRGPCTVNEIAAGLQKLLRLSRAFNSQQISDSIERLIADGKAECSDSRRFRLTPDGRTGNEEIRLRAAQDSERRIALLKRELVSRVGYTVDDGQVKQLWNRLCEELGELIARQGARLVHTLEKFRASGEVDALRIHTAGHLSSVCSRAVSHFGRAEVKEEVADALAASLTESADLARDWLELLLSSWIAACQLGMVPEVSQQIQRPLRRLILALDTDVVLSVICEAEPDHANLSSLLGNWEAIGGRTLIAGEVLAEVSTHAWIADIEFNEIAGIIQKFPYDTGYAKHYAKNAFVRAFWSFSKDRSPKEWREYIRVFRGSSREDSSNISAHLGRLALGGKIEEPSAVACAQFSGLEGRVRGSLARMSRFAKSDTSGGAIEQDKMDRDTKALVKYAATALGVSDTNGVLLISSSKRLQIAVRQGAPGSKVAVSPASTFALLMATASVSGGSPRSIASLMIQESAGEPVHALRVELMRLLARADLNDAIPQSRVVTLERQLEAAIFELAKKKRRPASLVRQEILTYSDKAESLDTFAEAFRATALGTEIDRLLRAQDEELRRRR